MRSNRSFVGTAVEIMSESLLGFITMSLNGKLPDGDWTKLLHQLDAKNGRISQPIEREDLIAQIRLLTTNLGSLGYLFRLTAPQRGFLLELREIRNGWAHGRDFDATDLQRALDTCKRLLMSLDLKTGASKIDELLAEIAEHESAQNVHANTVQQSEDSVAADSMERPTVDVESPTSVLSSEVKISVSCSPAINYATVQARFPILDRIVLDYSGTEVLPVIVTAVVTSADTNVSTVAERRMALAPGITPLHDLNVKLDPDIFSGIDSRRPGKLVVQVLANEKVIAESRDGIELLPGSHWTGTSTQMDAELLAAFVQPQHPEITGILSDVSDLLLVRTGRSQLEGHQGGPERVDAIVEAVFDVLGNRQIRYSNPPASWELAHLGGQHIRSAEEVLSKRFGTCIDTSVLLASILEQLDINSTLWLVEGHAFIAYWRFEAQLPSASLDADSAGLLFNLVAADKLRIVETTALTNEKKSSIASSSANTHRNFAQGEQAAAKLEFVIDVAQARASGIFPLPARHVSSSGDVTVVEYTPADPKTLDSFFKEKSQRPIDTNATNRDANVPARVVQWKNGLLDLSLRNRLLNFTKTARFPFAVPAHAVGSFEDLISDGKAIELLPSDAIGAVDLDRYKSGTMLPDDRRIELLLNQGHVYVDAASAPYKTKLRKTASEAKTIVDQSGANNLYLAMGTLLWNLDGKELRSPLILIPVNLVPAGRGGHFRVVRDEGGSSTPNYCLAEKLREQFNFSIPKFENPDVDSSGIDLESVFAAVTEAVMNADLPFHVEKTVDLAILQFAKFRMWKDLDENWSTFLNAPLVKHLVETPTSEFADPMTFTDRDANTDLDDLASVLPIPADASQIEAIASAAEGRTFVLEGPPGTGKSQTITNLLANSMSSGKRVLFVAEKRAALEVVRRRLDDVGLGAYALDLHDKGARPNEVRKQIRDSIDHLVFADDQGMQLVKSDLRSARRKLALYASNLHEENSAGYSAYSAYNSALVVDSHIPALPITEKFASETEVHVISAVRDAMSELPESSEGAHPQVDHPWGFVDYPLDDIAIVNVVDAVASLNEALMQVEQHDNSDLLRKLLLSVANPKQLVLAADLVSAETTLEVLDEISTPGWDQRARSLNDNTAEFAKNMSWLPNVVNPSALFMELLPIREAAIEAENSGFLGLGKTKRRLQVIAENFGDLWHGGESDVKNLVAVLSGLIDARSQCAELVEGFGQLGGVELAPNWSPFNSEHVNQVASRIEELSELDRILTEAKANATQETQITNLRAIISASNMDPQSVARCIRAVESAWSALRETLDSQLNQSQQWAGELTFLEKYTQTRSDLAEDKASINRSLIRWNAFIHALETLRKHGLDEARQVLKDGVYPAEDALRGFMKGTAEAALHERLGANALDDFSENNHLRNIERFRTSSKDIRGHLIKALPAKISERRASQLESQHSRMGELQRHLNRRRGGLSVRQLMTRYGDLITTILPCVLVSPDSASRFFPPVSGQFDLVVFDEASQIRVADAIGTLGRSKTAVIVGDSKQMPPTSFGAAAFDDDLEENELDVVADEESILSECIQARVPRQWLSWHYRSQDESLIAFSNQHYYEGKLSSFPAPNNSQRSVDASGRGISLVRVDGNFHRSGATNLLRTNPIEAEAIVDEVKRRFAASPDTTPSLGIITFNVQQRNYIENLIRDLGDDRLVDALDADSEGLFVKNLENVQGDERDVILFSTAFSVNDSGKLPLNFGPLNNAGGERRLNVAVTRARRQVVVFSSFAPEDLRAENSSSVGLKHLRAYLDLAAQGTRVFGDTSHQMGEDRHRDHLAEKIRDLGFVVETNVGLSEFKIDLTIATKERSKEPLAAILLDNETWAQRRTVGDRDGLPEEVLVNLMKWKLVLRVWLPAWLQAPESILARVSEQMKKADSGRAAAENVIEAPKELTHAAEIFYLDNQETKSFEPAADGQTNRGADNSVDVEDSVLVPNPHEHKSFLADENMPDVEIPTPGAGDSEVTEEIFETPATEQSRHGGKHQQWNPRQIGTTEELDLLSSRKIRMKASDLLSEIASVEWPIHAKRLSKLANGAFELGKVAAAREKAMLRCLDKNLYLVDEDHFVWPHDLNLDGWRSYRSDFSANGLLMTEISPREIANVMCQIISELGELEKEELKRETMAFFGYKRLTTGISSWLQRGLEIAVRQGRLATADGRIVPAILR